MKMGSLKATAATIDHERFRDDLIDLLKDHAGTLGAAEMLAVAAHMVGQILAMQDARKWTPENALKLVLRNIEEGNAEAIENASRWMTSA